MGGSMYGINNLVEIFSSVIVGRWNQDGVTFCRALSLLDFDSDVELHLAGLTHESDRTIIPSSHKPLIFHRFSIRVKLKKVHHILISLDGRQSLVGHSRQGTHHTNQGSRRGGIDDGGRNDIQHVFRVLGRLQAFSVGEQSTNCGTMYITTQKCNPKFQWSFMSSRSSGSALKLLQNPGTTPNFRIALNMNRSGFSRIFSAKTILG